MTFLLYRKSEIERLIFLAQKTMWERSLLSSSQNANTWLEKM